MPKSMLFWVLMLFWAFMGGWGNYNPAPNPFRMWGHWLLTFVLFAVIGWAVFGSAVR